MLLSAPFENGTSKHEETVILPFLTVYESREYLLVEPGCSEESQPTEFIYRHLTCKNCP